MKKFCMNILTFQHGWNVAVVVIRARAQFAENQLTGLLSVAATDDALSFTGSLVEALVAEPANDFVKKQSILSLSRLTSPLQESSPFWA